MTAPPGLIVDATVPEDAVTATLQKWMPTYLAHLCRLDVERRGADGLAPEAIQMPASWHTVNEALEKWPEDQLAAMYVIAGGIVDKPARQGDGKYRGTWRVGVAAVVEANSRDATNRLAKLYGAAIVGSLVQHPSLGGVAAGLDWLGFNVDAVPNRLSRTLAGCEATFDVRFDQLVDAFDGLPEPQPGDPPAAAPDRGEYGTHHVQIDQPEEA